jgi:putative membrane protein
MRVLVLAIDRDDDFGRKAGVRGPVVGKGKCIDAALKLSLADPEDSDANVLYAAVKLYDELKKSGEFDDVEVALITGHPDVGVKSDIELGKQLDQVLKRFPADGVIPVTDGAEDEQIFPIIFSKVPIVSSRRVVVKQNETIETTYYVIYRYIKEILSDPEAAKVFLGIPGFILLLYGIGKLISITHPESMNIISGIISGTLLLLIGGYAFTRGFRLKIVESITQEFIQVIFGVGGLLVIIAGMINSYVTLPDLASMVLHHQPETGLINFILYIYSINGTIIVGIAIILVGRVIQAYLRRDPHIWYNIAAILILPTFWIIIDLTTRYAMSVLILASFGTIMEVLAAIIDVVFSVFVGSAVRRYFTGWARSDEIGADRRAEAL